MRKFLSILLLATFLACLIAVGLGFYAGWFTTTTQRDPAQDGKVVVALEVDTDKIKADTKDARKTVEKAGEAVKDKLQELAGSTTVQGKVMDVDETTRTLTLTTSEGKELTVQVAPQAEVQLMGKDGGLKDLQPGDDVTVVYKSEDGKNLARSIIAVRG